MQIRLKRAVFGAGLVLLIVLGGCGRPATATVLPLPPASTAVAFQATLTALPRPLDGTPQPTPAPVEPNLPPGSGRLLYSSADSNATLIAPASGGPARPWLLANGDERWWFGGRPEPWSPDGSMLINARFSKPQSEMVFRVADTEGANIREVARIPIVGIEGPDNITWSPDSRKVAFIMSRSKDNDIGYSHKRLMVIDVVAGSAVTVAEDVNLNDSFMAWSPDSTAIAFSTDTARDPEAPPSLQTVRSDGTGQKTLIKGLKSYTLFWLSDGMILFNGDCDGSGYTVLCRLDPASGAYQPLYQTAERWHALHFINISRDQQWLVGIDYSPRTVFMLNLRTGAVNTIAADGANFLLNGIIWSPDGRYLAFWAQDGYTYVHELGSGQPLRPLISRHIQAWLPEEK